MDTINKLLKKQAPKQRRGRAMEGVDDATPNTHDAEPEKPNPMFVRWISTRQGSVVAVPDEWLGTPVGEVFEHGKGSQPPRSTVGAQV